MKLTRSERYDETEKVKRQTFDDLIRKKLGDAAQFPPKHLPDNTYTPYLGDEELDVPELPEDNDPLNPDRVEMFEKPITDRFIHAEVHLPQGERTQTAKVIGRTKDVDGNTIGTFNEHPLHNSMVYDVEFPDGEVKEYSEQYYIVN